MKQLLLGLLFLTVAFAGQAQQATHLAYPYRETKYFDSTGVELPTPVNSAYWLQTTYNDSVRGIVRRCYPSGKLKEYIPYADLQRRIIHGTVSTWYENGQMQSKEEYVGGYRHGQLLVYYPTGALQRRDTYEAGRNLIGTCFSPNGQPLPYSPYEQLPLYPGGDALLSKEVVRNVTLSAAERMYLPSVNVHIEQHGLSNSNRYQSIGKVKVDFTVAADGTVKDVAITGSSMYPSVNEKVVAAIRRLRRFIPAKRNGSLVEARLEMLLSFDMSAPFIRSHSSRL